MHQSNILHKFSFIGQSFLFSRSFRCPVFPTTNFFFFFAKYHSPPFIQSSQFFLLSLLFIFCCDVKWANLLACAELYSSSIQIRKRETRNERTHRRTDDRDETTREEHGNLCTTLHCTITVHRTVLYTSHLFALVAAFKRTGCLSTSEKQSCTWGL